MSCCYLPSSIEIAAFLCLSLLASFWVFLCVLFSSESLYLILSCISRIISIFSVCLQVPACLHPLLKQTDLSMLQGSTSTSAPHTLNPLFQLPLPIFSSSPTKTIPLSFPTLTSKGKTLEGVLEHPALECECVAFVCLQVSMCVLQGCVGLLCCLVFVEILWGDDEARRWRAGRCALPGRIWHHKSWVAAATFFMQLSNRLWFG